jgi:fatty-acyl-CoA synthase
MSIAAGLRRSGARPGDRIACLLTNSPDCCAAIIGIWLAGCCAVSLPLPGRGMSLAYYLRFLRVPLEDTHAVFLLVSLQHRSLIPTNGLSVRVLTFEELDGLPTGDGAPMAADEVLFIQYSSGSTAEPRGCALTGAAIAAQLSLLEVALEIDPESDVGVVWLPLAHDMGLFGCLLLTYWTGHRLVLSTPGRFLTQPSSWFSDAARYGATVSATPPFGLELAARVASAREGGSVPMKRMVVGGDRVDEDTLRRAVRALTQNRLPWSSLLPAYGLAEVVLAATMTRLGRGPSVLSTDEISATGEPGLQLRQMLQNRRTIVTSGEPLPGVRVGVVEAQSVGEIEIASPSAAKAYVPPSPQQGNLAEEGIVRTGDIGLVQNGQLAILGRADDLMSVAGRNVFGRDVEQALNEIISVRSGCCAVVDVESSDGKQFVALVEPVDNHPSFKAIADAVAAVARQAAGVGISECVFLPKGLLPKTPSGKLQRHRCRDIAASGEADGFRRIRISTRSRAAW